MRKRSTNGRGQALAFAAISALSATGVSTAEGFPPEFELSSLATGNGSTGFVLTGTDPDDRTGLAVAIVGDLNGDGIADMAVTLGTRSDDTYVIFGRDQAAGGFPPEFKLISLATGNGTWGFVAKGGAIPGGAAVDINNDGFDDLVVTDWNVAPKSYVIFGRNEPFPAQLELSDLAGGDGSAGIAISGASANGAAGDVNGDGIDDLLLSSGSGQSYIVYGRDASTGGFPPEFDVSILATGNGSLGFLLTGGTANGGGGSIGDVNGDGIDDFIITANDSDPGAPYDRGQVYVVFGRHSAYGRFPARFDLSSLASGDGFSGFVLNAENIRRTFFYLTAGGAGDINSDGFADLVVGAPNADPNDWPQKGRSYVLLGRAPFVGFPSQIELASLVDSDGSSGFFLDGEIDDERFGFSVGSAGDINDDGIDDFFVGASRGNPVYLRGDAGKTYIFYGRNSTSGPFPGEIVSGTLKAGDGSAGFVLNGIEWEDYSGWSVGGGGDVNGDQIDDLIIGAPFADKELYGYDEGEVYVVFGRSGGGGGRVGAMGDYVWSDTNGDGVQGAAEVGFPGVKVSLRKCNGPILASVATNSAGKYRFSGLSAGSYQIQVTPPANAAFSPKGAGTDGSRNSDVALDTGITSCANFTAAGEQRMSADAGLVVTPNGGVSSIGDFVWNDLDRDGIQDKQEPGLRRVRVRLYNCVNHAKKAVTYTNADGKYSFSSLPAGRYYVEFVRPEGMTPSPRAVGDPARDSDGEYSRCLNVGIASQLRGVDAGFFR